MNCINAYNTYIHILYLITMDTTGELPVESNYGVGDTSPEFADIKEWYLRGITLKRRDEHEEDSNTESSDSDHEESGDKMVKSGYNAFMQWDGTLKQKVELRKKYGIQVVLWMFKCVELVSWFVGNIPIFYNWK